MKFLEKEILIMKHISLIHYIVSVLLIITSCNSKEPVKQTFNKNNIQIEHNTSPEILREQLIGRAKKILNNTERTPLPFQTEFKEYKNKEIADLLEKKGEPNALDSIFKSSDLEKSWFKSNGIFKINNVNCRFLARLNNPYKDYEILLYDIKGKFEYQYKYYPIYIFVVDKKTLNLVSNSQIGLHYLLDKINEIDKKGISFSRLKIDSNLEIFTDINEEFQPAYSPRYKKRQKVLGNGQIHQYPTSITSFDKNYGFMTYFGIEDSISISFYNKDYKDKDNFYVHLELEGFKFKNTPLVNQFKDKFELIDEDGLKRLEILSYKQALDNSSCDVRKDICYDAHFIFHMHNPSIKDTITDGYLEVQYKHLPNSILELKKRTGKSLKDLQESYWQVYNLNHSIDYTPEKRKEFYTINTSRWDRSDYYHEGVEIPDSYVGLEAPELKFNKATQINLNKYLAKIPKELNDSLVINLNGEFLDSVTAKEFPKLFSKYENRSIDSNLTFLAIPKNSLDQPYQIYILKNKGRNTYYLVKYLWTSPKEGNIVDIKLLPSDKPLYSNSGGISQVTAFLMMESIDTREKKWLFNSYIEIKETQEKIIKYIGFENELHEEIVAIHDYENEFSIGSPNSIVPIVKGNQKLFSEYYNRPTFYVKEYTEDKSGNYYRYFYDNNSISDTLASNILDIKYELIKDEFILLEFRSAPTEKKLEAKPYITCKIYPEEHEKHIDWKFSYFQAQSLKELKELLKE